jgi:carbonic anhydrase/acetyltransferase-like protein (isoleucine patch superfamily)
MNISNLNKHRLATSKMKFAGEHDSVTGWGRVGNGGSVWPGAVIRGGTLGLSAAPKSNRSRFSRAEP